MVHSRTHAAVEVAQHVLPRLAYDRDEVNVVRIAHDRAVSIPRFFPGAFKIERVPNMEMHDVNTTAACLQYLKVAEERR